VIPILDRSDVKKCTACGRSAPRLLSKEGRRNTYFIIQVTSVDLKRKTVRVVGDTLFRAYGCTLVSLRD
jgi:hypothetical protein